MTKQERAAYIARRLEELYPIPHIALTHSNPYTLLVSVVLSAQCTDARVNRVTPHLFARADTPEKMMHVPVKEVEKIIKPCGLAPRKSEAIVDLSRVIVEKHGGKVPASFEELEELKGVGHKTASVVMAQAFGVPAFPIDTHIHRLSQRWGLSSGKSVRETEECLKALFPEARWNKLHIQIILYGRQYCSARGCDGMRCEICRTCYPDRKKPVVTRK